MHSTFQFKTSPDDFLARVTDAAYRVLLGDGLPRSFVVVELELWQQIRRVFRNELVPREEGRRQRWEHMPSELSWAEVA